MAAEERSFNRYCENLLARYNRRDTVATTSRVEGLCAILRREGCEVIQTMFGGSVRRGTYVNGLSDVDVLLMVNQSSLVSRPPAYAIGHVEGIVKRRFPNNPVRSGNLAVTIEYSDGTEIQILPTIRTRNGVRVAEPGSSGWSNIIQPDRFAVRLAEVNTARHGRVVPTIKLAKAIMDCYVRRASRKITGYHMESLAIEAFVNYQGPLNPEAMLVHHFSNSVKAVLTPIVDSTGQSRCVDEYLGPAGSPSRRRASTYFRQMRSKVKSSRTRAQMDALFCEGDLGRRE